MTTLPFPELKADRSQRRFDIRALIAAREGERYSLNAKHLNEMMVRVFQTIGSDVGFQRGVGQYLYDRRGDRYLDLLSGWGVFGIGRNHPLLREALSGVLDAELPNLVQMDVSLLAGLLAERLLGFTPYLDKVFFANSGTEAVEAAIKFARARDRPAGIVYCEHAFHGLTYGALSLNGDAMFREGFEPLAAGLRRDPVQRSRRAGATRWRRAKSPPSSSSRSRARASTCPTTSISRGAARLCRKYGTLFIADEIQTGIGRTGTVSRGRTLGRRAGHGAARQGAVGRPCRRSARC